MFARLQARALARDLSSAGIRGETQGWSSADARIETSAPDGRRVVVMRSRGPQGAHVTQFRAVLPRYKPDVNRYDPKPPTKPEGVAPRLLDDRTSEAMRDLKTAFEALPRFSGVLVEAPPPTFRIEPPRPRDANAAVPDTRPEYLLDVQHLVLTLDAVDLPPELLRLAYDTVVAVADRLDATAT